MTNDTIHYLQILLHIIQYTLKVIPCTQFWANPPWFGFVQNTYIKICPPVESLIIGIYTLIWPRHYCGAPKWNCNVARSGFHIHLFAGRHKIDASSLYNSHINYKNQTSSTFVTVAPSTEGHIQSTIMGFVYTYMLS